MVTTTITEQADVSIEFNGLELNGTLQHDIGHTCLTLFTDEGPERLSTSLQSYGYLPTLDNVYIKDYSEHSGLTAALVAAGLVRKVGAVDVGPFASTVHEVEVTIR
jgi:hypothetical protein